MATHDRLKEIMSCLHTLLLPTHKIIKRLDNKYCVVTKANDDAIVTCSDMLKTPEAQVELALHWRLSMNNQFSYDLRHVKDSKTAEEALTCITLSASRIIKARTLMYELLDLFPSKDFYITESIPAKITSADKEHINIIHNGTLEYRCNYMDVECIWSVSNKSFKLLIRRLIASIKNT